MTFLSGTELRDAALERVQQGSPEWFGKALLVIAALPDGWEGIAEEWRFVIEGKFGSPHTDKIWGALTMTATKKGLIEDTGKTISMRDPRSHGRRSTIWRRVKTMNAPTTTPVMENGIDKRVEQYIKIRDMIRDMEKKHEEALKPYKEALDGLNNLLLKHLQDMGVESARTVAGTVYKSERTSASIADVDAFWKYVLDNQAYELIDKRANKTAVTDFVREHQAAPPGVNYSVSHVVGVRRS